MGVTPGQVFRMRANGPDIRKAEFLLKTVAIAQRLPEKLAGIEKDDGRRRVDLRHHMQKHGGFRPEGRDNGNAAAKFVSNGGFQQLDAAQALMALAQALQRRRNDGRRVHYRRAILTHCRLSGALSEIDSCHLSQPFSSI